MHQILIAAAGAGAALGYAQAKARWFSGKLPFTNGINPADEVEALLYAERYFDLPPSASDARLHTVGGLLRQWAIDAYLSLIGSEGSRPPFCEISDMTIASFK